MEPSTRSSTVSMVGVVFDILGQGGLGKDEYQERKCVEI